MQYEFTIKLNQDDLDKVLVALEKLPFAEVMYLIKNIAHQVSDQTADAAEFEFDMEQAAMNWKPTPPSNMTMEEALRHLKQQLDQADAKRAKPAAKKKVVTRKKRGAK